MKAYMLLPYKITISTLRYKYRAKNSLGASSITLLPSPNVLLTLKSSRWKRNRRCVSGKKHIKCAAAG